MRRSNYVLVMIGSPMFATGKNVLVEVHGDYTFIDNYKIEAFKAACAALGLIASDCKLLDWKFLGDDLTFVL